MTIPASQFVKVNPGVLAAGGSNLVLNGLFLTENLAMPTGEIQVEGPPGLDGGVGRILGLHVPPVELHAIHEGFLHVDGIGSSGIKA